MEPLREGGNWRAAVLLFLALETSSMATGENRRPLSAPADSRVSSRRCSVSGASFQVDEWTSLNPFGKTKTTGVEVVN